MAIRLSQEKFYKLVEQAMETLPPQFEPYMENVVVEVQPLPSRDMMRQMHVRGRRENLLGLYYGVPLTKKSVSAPIDWPERIYIFQKNIESICNSEDEIIDQVRQTVLHEVGHHFGMDEDDLDRLGYG